MKNTAVTTKNALPRKMLQKIWVAVKFVCFGVGGFFLLLFSSFTLVDWFTPPWQRHTIPYLAFALAAAGALMMLFGVGEWGRWAYLWVFLSVPLAVFLLSVTPSDKGTGILIFAVPLTISCIAVRAYYRRRGAGSVPVPASEGQSSK